MFGRSPSAVERLRAINKVAWLLTSLLFLFSFAAGGLLAYLTKIPPGAIARGVSIGPFDVSGMTEEQALSLIASQTAAMEARGVLFRHGESSVALGSSIDSKVNADLSVQVFSYMPERAIAEALKIGHTGSLSHKGFERIMVRLTGRSIPLDVRIDRERIAQFLKSYFGKFEKPFTETALTARMTSTSTPSVVIAPGIPGTAFDYAGAVNALSDRIQNFNYNPIVLKLASVAPQITPRQAQEATPAVVALLQGGDIMLASGGARMAVAPSQFAPWVGIARVSGGTVALALDPSRVQDTLAPFLKTIERPVVEPRFAIENNRVSEFQPPENGQRVDTDDMLARLAHALFEGGAREIPLTLLAEAPVITAGKISELGVSERIGSATTRFTGSPKNRRANIKTGASGLNGLLIAPGEEFSVVKALGDIDDAHGYLPELVIKENQTVPEFGGGLCQVSTTVFRAVMSAGLPVTERSNHAYRVQYYEPAGKDATIYSPKPDFKFINDTPHYILIQTRVAGDALTVEFWGTHDGRTAWQSDSRVFNIVPPPDPKLLETTDVPAGVKKCTERAHPGADAVFTYVITYADGRANKKTFFSRYKPWGEVCVIGVAKKNGAAGDSTQSINPGAL